MLARAAKTLAVECCIVGTADNGQNLLAAAARLDPDVIVLDITMPEINGLEAARKLRQTNPRAKLLFLTVHGDADFALAAFEADGLGYVVKSRLATDLLPALRAVLTGCRFLSPTITLN